MVGTHWAARKLKVWAGNWDSNRWASEWIVSSSSQIKVSEKDVERVQKETRIAPDGLLRG